MTRKQQVAIADRLRRAASDLECVGNRLLQGGLKLEGSQVVIFARRIGDIGHDLGGKASANQQVLLDRVTRKWEPVN
jgi:hypothetical protein